MSLVQLPVQRDRLNPGDVFILVCGEDKVWLWIRSDANANERAKGSEVAMAFCKGGARGDLYHIKGIRTNLSLVQLPVQRDRLNYTPVHLNG